MHGMTFVFILEYDTIQAGLISSAFLYAQEEKHKPRSLL
jgi:hypothetical protein